VDYPGFNLKIAKFVKAQNICPVYYYISPKIWAWKEHRIKDIRATIDRLFSILPFEVDFFEKKHNYPISYVGNPTVDEICQFRATYKDTLENFCQQNDLNPQRPIIALLAGSRKQEIKDNLCMMCEAAAPYVEQDYQLVLAGAPSITQEYYDQTLKHLNWSADRLPRILRSQTYPLLSHATAALVTSGTAALETGLFHVPQVVCYYIPMGKLITFLRRHLLKVKYISLVNLVAGREVVPELVADGMTVNNLRQHLTSILPGGTAREAQLKGYEEMAKILGEPGAPERAAQEIVTRLKGK
jgi:lipid-A-disaccharide synthase